MATSRINASWLQHASSRNVPWRISPTSRVWNATRWCSSPRISSARILATTSWISPANAWPHASTYAWPHATTYAWLHAPTHARPYASSNARNGSRLCSSCYDGSSDSHGSTRILPLASALNGYFSSRCPRKTHASQNNQS